MFSITLKLMRKNMRMLIPAGIAILIGTAFIAATFLFGNAMNDTLARQMTAQYGGANYVVAADIDGDSSTEARDAAYGRTIADFHLDDMTAVAGVRPDLTVSVVVSTTDGHVSGVAVSTSADVALLPVKVTEGVQPDGGDGIALPKGIADQLGVGVGDDVTVESRWSGDDGTAVTLHVTGLTDDPDGAYPYYGGASVLSDDAMAAMVGVDSFDAINCTSYLLHIPGAGAKGTTPDDTARRAIDTVESLLPDDYRLSTRADIDRTPFSESEGRRE